MTTEADTAKQHAALWRALQPLRSVSLWLMTGAHPDDEWSGFLAWLALARGVRTVYACATRGEGGQNALGPARGRALGALRSREMERSAAELDLAVHWLGAGPTHGDDDPVHDFGFSRSGEDTLARWGEARLTTRIATLIRRLRPDALSPTFLDVPGQHGHHRAVTSCTLRAAALAADPAWQPEGAAAPWRVPAIFLPAFSGAGGSYDDEQPPPPATITLDLGEPCAALGASWAQLGEQARRWHASQGMGRHLPDGPRPFPLHRHAGSTLAPLTGPPATLATLADHPSDAPALRAADTAVAEALSAWPAADAVAGALHRALGALAGLPDIAGRVALKQRQLARAAAIARGISATLDLTPAIPRAGAPAMLRATVTGPATISPRHPAAWHITAAEGGHTIVPPPTAAPFGTQRDGFDPLAANDPLGATLHWTHAGIAAQLPVDLPERLALAPASDVSLTPRALVRRTTSTTPPDVLLTGAPPPAKWPLATAHGPRLTLSPSPGRSLLPPAGARLAVLHTPAIGRTAHLEPASLALLRADIAIDPTARVGVVAGAADETLPWLQQLDIAAEPLDDATLLHSDLERFTTLLVGILGFGQRPALLAARPRLMAWLAAGGSLVTLYHRPSDGWHNGVTPPLPLRIGSPSLRWRVTNPAAPVRVLAPGHALLRTPNAIEPADWTGWVRERGLYFASDWHHAYTPLLAIADPGEPVLHGALLAAPVGAGRHVHVALALHHQFAALVPGAFRLLANLVAAPRGE